MSENLNPYSKSDGKKLERPVIKQPRLVFNENIQQETSDSLSSDYTKTEGELSSALFVIVSGGIRREKQYFSKIMDMRTFPRINVRFIGRNDETGEEGLSPDKMYDEAIKIKKRFEENQTSNIDDSIYLVADVDEFMDVLLQIRPLCIKENFRLIISNSCFEVWLYFSCRSDIPDFPIPERIETLSWRFKEWLPTVIHGGINPTKAIFSLQQNIDNAKVNYKEDENGIPTLFSTNMFVLAEALLPLIEGELIGLIEENNRREAKFRNRKE